MTLVLGGGVRKVGVHGVVLELEEDAAVVAFAAGDKAELALVERSRLWRRSEVPSGTRIVDFKQDPDAAELARG